MQQFAFLPCKKVKKCSLISLLPHPFLTLVSLSLSLCISISLSLLLHVYICFICERLDFALWGLWYWWNYACFDEGKDEREKKEGSPPCIKLSLGYVVEEEEKVANAIAKSVFTTAQFHELQLQAVIFKYIVSGLPVPFHLFFTIWNTVSSSLGSAVINKLYPTCNVLLLWLFFCPFPYYILLVEWTKLVLSIQECVFFGWTGEILLDESSLF